MKTPEQIAADYAQRWANAPAFGVEFSTVEDTIRRAIEADRAQRKPDYAEAGFDNQLPHAIHTVLMERADSDLDDTSALRAAEWVKDNENDQLWDRYIGPLLDRIEADRGHDA